MTVPSSRKNILLIGEREGMLAARLGGMGDTEVTWLEPGPAARGSKPIYSNPPVPYERVTGDCCHLVYPDGHFDRVVSQHMIEHLEDPAAALAEWARVLKVGGKLVLVTRNALFHGVDQNPEPRPRRTFDPRGLRVLVKGAGLEVTDITSLIPDLKVQALYRGDLSFSLFFVKLPFFRQRGRLLFISAVKAGGGVRNWTESR